MYMHTLQNSFCPKECTIFRSDKHFSVLRNFRKFSSVNLSSFSKSFVEPEITISNFLFQLEERPDMGPGYHVEGPINAIYTEILLSRLCHEDI
jgi:hypothetical protein